jgi:probable rRNA maturation factor
MTHVEVVNRQRKRRVATTPLRAFLERAAQAAPAPGETTVTVCLLSDRAMKALNERWRGHPRTTDVLSFPSGDAIAPGRPAYLGDIAVSVEQAARQAAERGTGLADELKRLVLHGWLHLLGHDHETDDGTMARLERRLARGLLAPPRGRR